MNKKVVLIASLLTVLSVGLASIGFALASPAPDGNAATDIAEPPVATKPQAVSDKTPPVAVDPALPQVPIAEPPAEPPISIDPRYPPVAVDPILGHVPPISIDPILGEPILGQQSQAPMRSESVTAKPVSLDRPVDGIIPPPTS